MSWLGLAEGYAADPLDAPSADQRAGGGSAYRAAARAGTASGSSLKSYKVVK